MTDEMLTPDQPDASDGAASETNPNMHWYVVKVQSGREESIKEAIERRVKIEGIEAFFSQIIIPVENVVEMRRGKRVNRKRKLYPGYLMVQVEFNDRVLYLFRETSGVGDFVGGGVNRPPPPMAPNEVAKMQSMAGKPVDQKEIPTSQFERGDHVKVKEGPFAGMEGEVKDLLEAKGQVRVGLMILGREVGVELEYWQVESA